MLIAKARFRRLIYGRKENLNQKEIVSNQRNTLKLSIWKARTLIEQTSKFSNRKPNKADLLTKFGFALLCLAFSAYSVRLSLPSFDQPLLLSFAILCPTSSALQPFHRVISIMYAMRFSSAFVRLPTRCRLPEVSRSESLNEKRCLPRCNLQCDRFCCNDLPRSKVLGCQALFRLGISLPATEWF